MTTACTYIPLKIVSFTEEIYREKRRTLNIAFAFDEKKKINPTVLHAKIRIVLKLAKGQQLSTFDILSKTQTLAENFVPICTKCNYAFIISNSQYI